MGFGFFHFEVLLGLAGSLITLLSVTLIFMRRELQAFNFYDSATLGLDSHSDGA